MNKKLTKRIESKLEKLQELLENITEAQAIDANDPETWDSDTLYDLAEQLKEALAILEDQKSQWPNAYGEPIIEPGLCSLIEDWASQKEEGHV